MTCCTNNYGFWEACLLDRQEALVSPLRKTSKQACDYQPVTDPPVSYTGAYLQGEWWQKGPNQRHKLYNKACQKLYILCLFHFI